MTIFDDTPLGRAADAALDRLDATTDPHDELPENTLGVALDSPTLARAFVGLDVDTSELHAIVTALVAVHRDAAIAMGPGNVERVLSGLATTCVLIGELHAEERHRGPRDRSPAYDEIERLQAWVDAAWNALLDGKQDAARKALTAARWGIRGHEQGG